MSEHEMYQLMPLVLRHISVIAVVAQRQWIIRSLSVETCAGILAGCLLSDAYPAPLVDDGKERYGGVKREHRAYH